MYPVKVAIESIVAVGVPQSTVILLLLLPFVSLLIAAFRNFVGVRGFGIFLPASLAVVFVAVGPLMGVGIFLVVATISTLVRLLLRRAKIKLHYLPRMSLILWFVCLAVLGVLYLSSTFKLDNPNISVFAILISALLVEDFIRVSLGKSLKTALTLTAETLFLALVSYTSMVVVPLGGVAYAHPDVYLLVILVANIVLGRFDGLRLLEIWRFRKLWKN
jgi:hypothetical protein